MAERTQVGIIGAGPAGLLLAHLLRLRGIESIVLERQSRHHVEERIRAGVLEQGTVDTLAEIGVDERLRRHGMVHRGVQLAFSGRRHRIDLAGLTGGKTITVYGQHEVVRDLIAARLAQGGPIVFEAEDVSVHDLDTERPRIRYRTPGGTEAEVECDFIGGCDGFHGVCRPSTPDGALRVFERDYPFGWLGILAEAPPTLDELVYAHSERGFALFSMRSPEITRLYLQCTPEEDAEAWSDEAIWAELHARLEVGDGWTVGEGPIVQKGVTAMRSFVVEPMQHGRLFLAGDSAHIVPPTGAKGLNLAAADVRVLAHGLAEHYAGRGDAVLEAYSAVCLRRVWTVQRFSWWMTSLTHRFPGDDAFGARIQTAELDYITSSRAGAETLAENYVGLPLDY